MREAILRHDHKVLSVLDHEDRGSCAKSDRKIVPHFFSGHPLRSE